MGIGPIVSAMRRNRVGAILIAVQIAVTYAVLCNSLFVIQQRVALSQRPSGADEQNIFVLESVSLAEPAELISRQRADLDSLRALPGVVDAYASGSYPFANDGFAEGFGATPAQDSPTAIGANYFADEHTLHTLGLTLIAGRNFLPEEVTNLESEELPTPAVLIVSRAFADQMFPKGGALGKSIYNAQPKSVSTIVGIVDRLQSPWTGATGPTSTFVDNTIMIPAHFASADAFYVIRCQPARLAVVMQAAQVSLIRLEPTRIIKLVQPMTAARADSYRDDLGVAIILGVVSAALVAVTVFGIVGLTSYWVSERQRQIGIRRALGATRAAILRYFQTENLLIASAGIGFGVMLALALNLWMVSSFEMARIGLIYPVVGAVLVLVIGQLAAFWPARRAASISPALATRGA